LTAASAPLTASSRPSSAHIGRSFTLAGFLVVPVLLAFKPKSSRKQMPRALYLAITLLLISTAGLSGCGKDKYIVLIKPQTYTFAVQGTATNFNTMEQAPVTLTVAQSL
jgi:hypothetical protein